LPTVGYIERGDFTLSLELAFRISEYFGLAIEAILSRKPFEVDLRFLHLRALNLKRQRTGRRMRQARRGVDPSPACTSRLRTHGFQHRPA